MATFLSYASPNAVSVRIRIRSSAGYGDWWDDGLGNFVASKPAALSMVAGSEPNLQTLSVGPFTGYTGELEVFYYESGNVVSTQRLTIEDGSSIPEVSFTGPPQAAVMTSITQNEAEQEVLVFVANQGIPVTGPATSTWVDKDNAGQVPATNNATPINDAPGWYSVQMSAAETNCDILTVTVVADGQSGSTPCNCVPAPWTATLPPERPHQEKVLVKDLAGQECSVYVYDSEGVPYSGSIVTATIALDGGAPSNLTGTPTAWGSSSPGWYRVPLTQAETNAEWGEIVLTGTAGEQGVSRVDFVPPAAAGAPPPGGDPVAVSTANVANYRTWLLRPEALGGAAGNVITLLPGTDAFLAMDFSRVLDEGDGILSVGSVTDSLGTLTPLEQLPNAVRKQVHLRFSGYATGREHRIVVTVGTEKGRALVGAGVLLVE